MAEDNQRPGAIKSSSDMVDANKVATDNVAYLLEKGDTLAKELEQRQGKENVFVEKYQNLYREPIKHVVDTGRSAIATAITAQETPVAEQIQSAMQPVSSSTTSEYKVKFFDTQPDNTSKNAPDTSDQPSISGPGHS